MTHTNMEQLAKKLELLIRPKINQPNVPFIHSQPGVGKSSLVAQHAKKHGLDLMDVRLPQFESVDIRGVPVPDLNNMITRWLPPEFFPFKGSKQFEGTSGILFFDEFNRARPDVMSAAFQLILDRRIGNHVLLDSWHMVAAGNFGEKDNTDVMTMDAATKNRFIHFYVDVEVDPWVKWALEYNVHSDIIGFIKVKPEFLYIFNDKDEDSLLVTPRSWEKYSNILKENAHLSPEVVASLIGVDQVGPAHGAFLKYLRDKNAISGKDVVEKFASDNDFHAIASKMEREHAYSINDSIINYIVKLKDKYQDKHFSNVHTYGMEVLDRDNYLAMMARMTKECSNAKSKYIEDYFKHYPLEMKDILEMYQKQVQKR